MAVVPVRVLNNNVDVMGDIQHPFIHVLGRNKVSEVVPLQAGKLFGQFFTPFSPRLVGSHDRRRHPLKCVIVGETWQLREGCGFFCHALEPLNVQ